MLNQARIIKTYQLKSKINLLFPIQRRRGKIKLKILLRLPLNSISTERFRMKTFSSTSRILRSLWSYFTNNNGSSLLVLHLQRPVWSRIIIRISELRNYYWIILCAIIMKNWWIQRLVFLHFSSKETIPRNIWMSVSFVMFLHKAI